EWKLSINYTYNDGRDVSNGENKPLSDLPFHTANGTLDWKPLALEDWSFYVSGHYTGQKRADSATAKTPGGGRLVILCFWSLYRAGPGDALRGNGNPDA
ncbi:hypothetical protein AAIH11_36500, partial [Pseudomonas aeruginosa]|uniref:hypothetical protein n=1 Tax=Pseudomonas aeruginosa TaxID=287 RepID=UPI0031B67CF3